MNAYQLKSIRTEDNTSRQSEGSKSGFIPDNRKLKKTSSTQASFVQRKSVVQLGKKRTAKRKKAKENHEALIEEENKENLVKIFKKEWKLKGLSTDQRTKEGNTYVEIINFLIRGAGYGNIEETEKMLNRFMQKADLKFELGFVYHKGKLKSMDIGGASGGRPGENATVAIKMDKVGRNAQKGDLVVTHNHPSGSPLSQGDVKQAVSRNYKEIRATGTHGTFSLKRRGANWGPINIITVFEAYSTKGAGLWGNTVPLLFKNYVPILSGQQEQTGTTFGKDFFMDKYFAAQWLANTYPTIVEYNAPRATNLIDMRRTLYESPRIDIRRRRDSFGSSGKSVMRGSSGAAMI